VGVELTDDLDDLALKQNYSLVNLTRLGISERRLIQKNLIKDSLQVPIVIFTRPTALPQKDIQHASRHRQFNFSHPVYPYHSALDNFFQLSELDVLYFMGFLPANGDDVLFHNVVIVDS
jgi:hypothetical protein